MNDAFRWHRAKWELEQKLMDANKKDIPKILYEWFEKTVFQLDITQTVNLEVIRLTRNKDAVYESLRRSAVGHIAEKIYDSKTYFTEVKREALDQDTITTSVLIVSTPRFIQSKTGKLSYIRD